MSKSLTDCQNVSAGCDQTAHRKGNYSSSSSHYSWEIIWEFSGVKTTCTGLQTWKKVIWSNKSSIFDWWGVKLWHTPWGWYRPECLTPTMRESGGSVVLREAFCWHSLGPLARLEQRVTANQYKLSDHHYPVMEHFTLEETILLQGDNAPSYSAPVITEWFDENENDVNQHQNTKWGSFIPPLESMPSLNEVVLDAWAGLNLTKTPFVGFFLKLLPVSTKTLVYMWLCANRWSGAQRERNRHTE